LIDLEDHAAFIDQKRRRNAEIPAAVEKIAIENVVDARDSEVAKSMGNEKRSFAANE